ncbi:MAG: hypothetical protein HOH26_17765 [Alphaproteobacteria bacterium]|jgi:hypothetical protein|nr:hypothetical protein [Alphaproteobacteria bacterium]MBT4084939.1 hypothetical protein [Alphaproteobacteria bacterium]MBT4545487.1 hypothetical protein [Alphaproteobacteria bacterium]MBT5161650.1 hypothetical protein [Alphaproteobacteria bacterium]MBT5920394.1 hypothetical protein [Alphaproteobacteria bacterium]
MRIGGMIALVAGAVMIASPALAECFGHTKTVQTKSESLTVQSSQPVTKPVTKKEG